MAGGPVAWALSNVVRRPVCSGAQWSAAARAGSETADRRQLRIRIRTQTPAGAKADQGKSGPGERAAADGQTGVQEEFWQKFWATGELLGVGL